MSIKPDPIVLELAYKIYNLVYCSSVKAIITPKRGWIRFITNINKIMQINSNKHNNQQYN
jgi:hypothetical protein